LLNGEIIIWLDTLHNRSFEKQKKGYI